MPSAQRDAAEKAFRDGNYRDAYEQYQKLLLDERAKGEQLASDLRKAVSCLQQLGRIAEVDSLLEEAVKAHATNWRLLHAAANVYDDMEHFGYLIAGQFERGTDVGRGEPVSAAARDRVRALQLMLQARPLVDEQASDEQAAEFYYQLAGMIGSGGHGATWQLQWLTNLEELPGYDDGWYHGGGEQYAPVDEDGKAVFYPAAESWETAKNDGQRWRWALERVMQLDASRRGEVYTRLAHFHQQQFGVQTLRQFSWFSFEVPGEDDESGKYAVHTLGDDETIARLAVGVRRFKLPDEFNHIKLFQQAAEAAEDQYGSGALEALAGVYANRRQYPKAADVWRRVIDEYGPGRERYRQHQLDQILGNWGRFEPLGVQPAGSGAELSFRFRNARRVQFEAFAVDIEQLLDDVQAYIRSKPARLDWDKISLDDIGNRLVAGNQKQYLGRRVAQWDLELEPREHHYDRLLTVSTPLEKAGVYLVTAMLEDGNTSRTLVWLEDTVIVTKQLDAQTLYYIADAASGQPIANAQVELFGWRQVHLERNNYRVDTVRHTYRTDEQGQIKVAPNADEQNHPYQWLVRVTTDDGRFAFKGFDHWQLSHYYQQTYSTYKAYTITDRPVYRPGQAVHYKFWIREATYQPIDDTARFGRQKYTVLLHNPRGDQVLEQEVTTDEYGGIEGTYELPSDAMLGNWQLVVQNIGGGGFRVEEYKKPEYEVTVEAPERPVMLGEQVKATIKAKYYFGAPVTQARVKYKIERSSYSQQWYPPRRWDWLFGPGYWWLAHDAPWYPGWRVWGCVSPSPWWIYRAEEPTELVAEAEVPIGPDGTVEVTIDTDVVKEMMGDRDHRYQITAEVVDASRRTIVGAGEVLVARKPFQVIAWVDRGYYRVGDTIEASMSAHTLDRKPVQGKGKLTLLAVRYENGKPIETPVRSWEVDTNAQGFASQKMEASAAGQYRLSYQLDDGHGHTIEGGYLLTVTGEGMDKDQFRFSALEVIPQQAQYQPGDTVQVQINTNRIGSTVLLFVRPANGVYKPPRVLQLDGRSTAVEIKVQQADMPNFFVEALSISGGEVHMVAREILVPPESRVIDVTVEPSAERYKPGEKAEVKLTLKDADGKPVVGTAVVSIYDKSVEYIAGGSRVADIKEFFWKWRRQHQPNQQTNLTGYFYNLLKSGERTLQQLGVFGDMVEHDRVDSFFLGFGGAHNDRAVSRSGAVTATAAPSAAPMEMAKAQDASDKDAQAPLVEPTVRSEFADTALWVGALETDGDGTAVVKLDMPENLTTWKIRTWALSTGTSVGEGAVEVITSKDLLVRLQAPRFFVETDEVVLSAVIHNYLDGNKNVQAVLELDGGTLEAIDDARSSITVAADGEARVDWRVRVTREGEAVVRMKALSDEESDAVEMRFPVYVHGMLKTDTVAGTLRPDQQSERFTFTVPSERKPEQSRLEVRYSPTLAGAMVDALPYLASYPYGCTEQTLNRFLPTVIVQKILIDMQISLKDVREHRANLNAQELGDPTDRAEQWQRYKENPVFSEREVEKMVREGIEALDDMQLSDGGWGWFSGYGEQSWPHTTAVVVHGLQVARAADVGVPNDMLARGVEWLMKYQQEEIARLANAGKKKRPYKQHADNLDALVYMVLVEADKPSGQMLEYLTRDRTELSVYGKALLGVALEQQGFDEELQRVLTNIEQYLVVDEENDTAWLELGEGNSWWYWHGSLIEAMATYLKLLARTDPQSEIAAGLVKYLLNNRKHATYWDSTRDTALCIEAMAEYLAASGELKPELTLEILIDGQLHKTVEITAANLFTYDDRLVLTGSELESGEHTVELRKRGRGPIYFSAYSTNFTKEEHITAAGLEVKVRRKFYRLVRDDRQELVAGERGQVITIGTENYRREEIVNLGQVTSGDLIEVELEIESKNDYEYLIFEDMKAAGLEAVDLRSGYTGNSLGAYMELRDNRTSFFIRWLPQGRHSLSYRLRAEIPGRYSALPAKAQAMYAPELVGNSDELKLQVEDREEAHSTRNN